MSSGSHADPRAPWAEQRTRAVPPTRFPYDVHTFSLPWPRVLGEHSA